MQSSTTTATTTTDHAPSCSDCGTEASRSMTWYGAPICHRCGAQRQRQRQLQLETLASDMLAQRPQLTLAEAVRSAAAQLADR